MLDRKNVVSLNTYQVEEKVQQYKHLDLEIKRLEKLARSVKDEIIEYANDDYEVTNALGQVIATCKIYPGRKIVDAKALERDMPDVYNKYTTVGKEYTRFCVK